MESASPYPSLNAAAAYVGSCIVLLMVSWSAWAAQGDLVSVDNWTEYPVGVLPVSGPGKWKIYSSMKVFKHPPSVVIDEDRRALLLKTDRETMAIGRSIHTDIATTRILVWEWKPVVLPVGGDVRELAAKRNDQVARVVAWFDASLFDERRAIAYIWDSSAPAGTIIRDRGLTPSEPSWWFGRARMAWVPGTAKRGTCTKTIETYSAMSPRSSSR